MILSAYRSTDRSELASDAIALCADTLRAGGLIGLPTETVYGLAADADNATAVHSIFTTKGRPAEHPLIVHVAALDGGMGGVSHFAERVPAFAQQLMSSFWPGPLTLILPRRAGIGAAAAGGQDSIGLRCPSHPVAQALLLSLRQPPQDMRVVWGLAAPSANKFGRVSPTTAAHVFDEFADTFSILDGGPCEVGIESTIVDCTRGAPVLLRPGAVSALQLEAACGRKPVAPEDSAWVSGSAAPRASGTLASHYAPDARVRLMSAKELQAAVDLLPLATKARESIAIYARTPLVRNAAGLPVRRMSDLASQCAHELFSVLRAFDSAGVKLIWVETPPPDASWDGVRDRLERAAA